MADLVTESEIFDRFVRPVMRSFPRLNRATLVDCLSEVLDIFGSGLVWLCAKVGGRILGEDFSFEVVAWGCSFEDFFLFEVFQLIVRVGPASSQAT